MAISALFLLAALAQPAGADDTPPYVVERTFEGHIECAAGLVVVVVQGCALVSPNNDFVFDWAVRHDLRTVTIGLDWTPTTPLGGETLLLLFHEGVCEEVGCGDAYPYFEGEVTPGTTIRIEDADIADPAYAWSALGDGSPLMARVFPTPDVEVLLQQDFTVTVTAYYVEPAP